MSQAPAIREGDVVTVLIPDPGPGRWDVGEQGVVTAILDPDDKYDFEVTLAGRQQMPDFLGGSLVPRRYYFRAHQVSGPVPPEQAWVRLED
jgi:hypothetical protein